MQRLIKLHQCLGALTLLALLALPANGQQDNSTPKPAMREYPGLIGKAGAPDQETEAQPSALNPDQTPLTGAQQLALGSPELRHSYWVPGFEFENMLQSNAPGTTLNGNWVSSSYLLGNVSLLEAWNHSELSVNYSGGGTLSNSSLLSGNYYHQLGLVQTFQWKRWQVRFLDQFSYLAQPSFGFGGVSNISIPGVGGMLGQGLPSLQTNYLPNQTIFTSVGPHFSDVLVTQAEYSLTPRTSLTAVGSIGTLRFTEGSLTDTNDAIFSLGYNYEFTPRDTIGLLYRFTGYRFIGNPQAMNDHTAEIAYGRKITGRLALALSAGPDVTTYRLPIATATDRVGVAAGASLRYAFQRTEVSLTYSRGLTAGSGVLTGADTDQTEGQISHKVSRQWQALAGFGYARNGVPGGARIGGSSQNFNSFYGSAGFSRTLSRSASFSLHYAFSYQNLSQPICLTGSCTPSYKQHQIWVGLRWQARPFVLR